MTAAMVMCQLNALALLFRRLIGPARLAKLAPMTTRFLAGLILLLALRRPASADDFDLQAGTKVQFATREEAAKLLVERDVFIQALSPFDRAARLKTDRETTEKEYLEFVAAQAAEWTAKEEKMLTGLLAALKPKLAPLKLSLPPVIRLVKTTGREEGAAAYCRGASIVLPQNMVDAGALALEIILPHELFHVFSSHNLKLRPALYAVVGFAPCAPVRFPESLAKRRITNPDAPGLDFYIMVKQGADRVPVMPILYSRSETYDTKAGGEFFDYMEFRLLVLEKDGEGMKPALDAQGQPRLLEPGDTPDYLAQLGKNTGYIIHPEEVLADNFVMLVNGKKKAPSPAIIEGLRKAILDGAAR